MDPLMQALGWIVLALLFVFVWSLLRVAARDRCGLRGEDDRGAVLLEMALVLPLLLMLILGGISVQFALNDKADLKGAARLIVESQALEDEAGAIAAAAGGILYCYAVIPGPGEPCYVDGAEGPRRQAVLVRPVRLELGLFAIPVTLRAGASAAVSS